MHIKEILLKEEEKHRLKYIGIIEDWVKVVALTENTFVCHEISFINMKEQLLKFFYFSILNYEKFIIEEKATNSNLKQHHFKKTGTYISTLSNEVKANLDKELKTPAGTSIAWHFSKMVYDEIYLFFCRNVPACRMPQETDEFFFNESKKKYPLTISQFIDRLAVDDPSFWSINARYLQDLSHMVVSYFLQRSDDFGFSDLIKDQTWTDAYKVLRDRLIEKQGNIPKFENGCDFRNYMIKVCKLLANNLHRKYIHKNDYIEDLSPIITEYNCDNDDENDTITTFFIDEESESTVSDYETYVLDINTHNPYELAHAVSIILLNSSHPLYLPLTDGIEDKVKILIDKVINDMSYNDIISEQYEERNLNEEDFRRAVVKARKDCERVRKVLCDRLKSFVNKKK